MKRISALASKMGQIKKINGNYHTKTNQGAFDIIKCLYFFCFTHFPILEARAEILKKPPQPSSNGVSVCELRPIIDGPSGVLI